jgi:large subunit ribosomal protein L31
MKKDIHPHYYIGTNIQCACGASLKTGATKEKMAVEICSQCHPFYTGKEKIIDAAGRVEKYKTRASKAKKASSKK